MVAALVAIELSLFFSMAAGALWLDQLFFLHGRGGDRMGMNVAFGLAELVRFLKLRISLDFADIISTDHGSRPHPWLGCSPPRDVEIGPNFPCILPYLPRWMGCHLCPGELPLDH